ncbi:hypothetical protein CQS04_07840 [Chryseomicrobium excrementi]|uniref:Uncharacterized protein n=1 Tax=Chryseomicrobium excrementi TaxID=2041346 RepID=A0A2M9F0S7_9BACL|nr:hypothetical protein [Chryseomicrobium excrementi]PJK17057.1 hypothetical protein CQS04_07840 [Chryseomicrobium excrementi]
MEPIWMLAIIALSATTAYLVVQVKKMQRYQIELEQQLALYIEAMDEKNADLLATVEALVAPRSESLTSLQKFEVQEKSRPLEHVTKTEQADSQVVSISEPTNEVIDQIFTMDQQGQSAAVIAEQLGRPQSEINLLIYMARKERRS